MTTFRNGLIVAFAVQLAISGRVKENSKLKELSDSQHPNTNYRQPPNAKYRIADCQGAKRLLPVPNEAPTAALFTKAFEKSCYRLALRQRTEVRIVNFGGERVALKVFRLNKDGGTDAEQLKLFIAESEMAAYAANSVGAPVYFHSGTNTKTEVPMLVMKKMDMGCGDAIRAGADPDLIITGISKLFAQLKKKWVFWSNVRSPNNIMTDSTLKGFGEGSRWYFVDFGAAVATVEEYDQAAQRMVSNPGLYDDDFQTFWAVLSNWVDQGITNFVDTDRTRPEVDPRNYTTAQRNDPLLYVVITPEEQKNLIAFQAALQKWGLYSKSI